MTEQQPPPDARIAIAPRPEQLAAVAALPPDTPVVMLNLLRFRDVADYGTHPGLAPEKPISGADAYRRYGAAAFPHLQAAGAEVVYRGTCRDTVIGPPDERWDVIILVRYPSVDAFLSMVTKAEYQELSGHREAALLDSRLVATLEAAD